MDVPDRWKYTFLAQQQGVEVGFYWVHIAYFVLRKGATQYAVRNTRYEALFQGKKAFEL